MKWVRFVFVLAFLLPLLPALADTAPILSVPDIWGLPAADIAISVRPVQETYKIGQPAPIQVKTKNFSDNAVTSARSGVAPADRVFHYYRLLVFDSSGRPLPILEPAIAASRRIIRSDGPELGPTGAKWGWGPKEEQEDTINVNDFVALEKEGSYDVIVSFGRLPDGVSNKITIKVVK